MTLRSKIYRLSKIVSTKLGALHGLSVLTGFVLALTLVACAGISFPYKYYGLSAASYENGKLMGPMAAQDLDFASCQPTKETATPCICMFTKEFLPMKQDYLQTKNALITCQKRVL